MTLPWLSNLSFDPVQPLLESGIPNLVYFVRRDLLDKSPGPLSQNWDLPEAKKILQKQAEDGSWKYPPRKNAYPGENYDLLSSYRNLGYLIELYGMDQTQPAISKAASYLLDHQAEEGDFRGIFGSQYAPHYSAGILELLIKAGFEEDRQIKKAFSWFENTRQLDGGWAWPIRTANVKYEDALSRVDPVRSDLSKPFSHALTAFVIRAYAAHPDFRRSPTALQAGTLLLSRLFKADKYPDRKAVSYWYKFQFPFWWGNLLTVLDSVSRLDISPNSPGLKKGLDWFSENQLESGYWPTGYDKNQKARSNQAWVCLAICRVLKRFHKE